MALEAAAQHPKLAAGIVLEDPPGMAELDTALLAAGVEAEGNAAKAHREAYWSVPAATTLTGTTKTWSTTLRRSRPLTRRRSPGRSGTACLGTCQVSISALQVPALVLLAPVVGSSFLLEGGSALRGEDREAVRALVPQDRFVELDGGHSLHRDDPASSRRAHQFVRSFGFLGLCLSCITAQSWPTTMPRWARSFAPVAEKVAHMLGQAMEGKYTPATPLTSAKLRSVQAVVKARRAEAVGRAPRDTAKQRPAQPAALPLYSCPDCGGPVTNPRHVLCESCQAGAGHTAPVRQSRGRAIAARKRTLKERVKAFGTDVDPAVYRERIWPKLAAVKLTDIMQATGYSKGYCSTIRNGKWAPHVSTWPALARLGWGGRGQPQRPPAVFPTRALRTPPGATLSSTLEPIRMPVEAPPPEVSTSSPTTPTMTVVPVLPIPAETLGEFGFGTGRQVVSIGRWVCPCGKWFRARSGLRDHGQATGHQPGDAKHASSDEVSPPVLCWVARGRAWPALWY